MNDLTMDNITSDTDVAAAVAAIEEVLRASSRAPITNVKVRYVHPEAEIEATRYLVVVLGQFGFLVDHTKGTTQSLPLADVNAHEDAQDLIQSAKSLAHTCGLDVVYVPLNEAN